MTRGIDFKVRGWRLQGKGKVAACKVCSLQACKGCSGAPSPLLAPTAAAAEACHCTRLTALHLSVMLACSAGRADGHQL